MLLGHDIEVNKSKSLKIFKNISVCFIATQVALFPKNSPSFQALRKLPLAWSESQNKPRKSFYINVDSKLKSKIEKPLSNLKRVKSINHIITYN